MFTEDLGPRRLPRAGFAKDVYEVESYVRGFARRRTDVGICLLRPANVIGPRLHSPMMSYLRLPVIPRVLGYDARLQFLHEQDLLSVLSLAAPTEIPSALTKLHESLDLAKGPIARAADGTPIVEGITYFDLRDPWLASPS